MRAVMVALLCAQLGCSWIGVQRLPPDAPDPRTAACTETKLIPLGDALLSGSFFVVGLWSLLFGVMGAPASGTTSEGRAYLLGIGGISAGVGLAFAFSSSAGFRWTRECRDAHGYDSTWRR